MLYSYTDCKNIFGSDYSIQKALDAQRIYKIEKGIYSDQEYVSELEIIQLKYPKAIFTSKSAFYYHGLTDVVPELYFMSTSKGTSGIRDKRVKQIFENSKEIDLGCTTISYNNIKITIYSKERMLVELIRNKNKLPFDYYKEIISNYRKIIHELDLTILQEYVYSLPKSNMVMETIQREVL